MPIVLPPQPPRASEPSVSKSDAAIVDMRPAFDRKSPQTADDRERTRVFTEGKIEMIRRDPKLTDAEKAAAIEALWARR